jgi:hypothetical protein
MLRLFRKWRLIRRLRKECLRHITKLGDGFVSIGKRTAVSKGAFAQQTASRSLWWKLCGEENKNKQFHEINSLLDSCIDDGLIERIKREGDEKIFIRTTFKGEDFCGHTDFLEALLSKYNNAYTKVGVPWLHSWPG